MCAGRTTMCLKLMMKSGLALLPVKSFYKRTTKPNSLSRDVRYGTYQYKDKQDSCIQTSIQYVLFNIKVQASFYTLFYRVSQKLQLQLLILNGLNIKTIMIRKNSEHRYLSRVKFDLRNDIGLLIYTPPFQAFLQLRNLQSKGYYSDNLEKII